MYLFFILHNNSWKVTNKPYFQNKEHSASNGKIYCVFDLDSSFDEHGVKFDLQKKNYAVLLARGPLKRKLLKNINILRLTVLIYMMVLVFF